MESSEERKKEPRRHSTQRGLCLPILPELFSFFSLWSRSVSHPYLCCTLSHRDLLLQDDTFLLYIYICYLHVYIYMHAWIYDYVTRWVCEEWAMEVSVRWVLLRPSLSFLYFVSAVVFLRFFLLLSFPNRRPERYSPRRRCMYTWGRGEHWCRRSLLKQLRQQKQWSIDFCFCWSGKKE